MDKLVLMTCILLADFVSVSCNHDDKNDLFTDPGLVWIEDMDGTMVFQHIPLTNELWRKSKFPQPSRIARTLPNTNRFTHLDVHIDNRTMVMVDTFSQKIVAITFDSLGMYFYWDLYEGISKKVNGIAVDWVTDVVYWTDDAYDVILAVSMYSPNMAVVIVDSQIDEPYGIVTFPKKGYLFWTDIDPKYPRIMRSTLGGRRIEPLCKFRLTSRRPMSLFIDYVSERLYWIYEDNVGLKGVSSCDINGNDMKQLQKAVTSKYFDIGVFVNQLLYIEDGGVNIYHMDRSNSGPKSNSIGSPLTMMFIDGDRQLQEPNGCLESGCPGVCTMSVFTEDCFCSPLLDNRIDPEVIERHCPGDVNRAFTGLLFPKADGIYTIKPNFVERGPLSTLSQAKPKKILSTKHPVKAIASDVRTMKIFFYEYKSNTIKSLSTKENSEPELISLAVGEVGGLAIDGKHLYWTDKEFGHIMVVREDGAYPHILHQNLDQPKALAIHPQKRIMIWSELATRKIMTSHLDGSLKHQIPIDNIHVYQIQDIAIDFSSGNEVRMYLCDGSGVFETDLEGSFFIIHYNKSFRHMFTGITILHDYLVVADTGYRASGLHVFDRKVFDKDGRIKKVGESLFPFGTYGNWFGARYHHIRNQPKNKRDMCRMKHATCEHLCVPLARTFTCICSTGYKKNGSSCIIDQPYTPSVILADLRYSRLFQIHAGQFVSIPTQGMHQPYSTAYDPVYKMVYWSDLETGTISRAFLNGTNQEVIKHDPHSYFIGLFIEPGSRLLLFMVRHKPEYDLYRQPIGSLVAMDIDTMKSKILLDRVLGDPHSVTVNVKHGYIYMTEQKNIWRINLRNFTDFVCLASQVLSPLVTTAEDYVYFVNEIPVDWYYEPKKTQIVRFGIDGENMTAMFDLYGGTVHDLAVDEYHIYWINGSTRTVQRVNFDNYDVIENVGPSKSLFMPTSLYVSPREYNYDSACTYSDCDGLCLPTLTEEVCDEDVTTEIVEVHNDSALCRIPDIKYGEILHNIAGRVVPRGYIAIVECFPAHIVSGDATITCLGGQWSDNPTCNLEYDICGTPKKGYKIYRESGSFFVYPGATLISVICIGGGGGGYDVTNDDIVRAGKAGDGGDSSFGSHLTAFGGKGGSLTEGGKGGQGRVDGESGSARQNCTTGGTAGVDMFQMTHNPGEPSSSVDLFCGTGGFSHECTGNSATDDKYAGDGGKGGNGSYAGNFGGGAGRRGGGSGGGGGYSRLTLTLPEKELVPVTVGQAGFPSYGHPAPGLVVVSWGDFRIDRFARSYDVINECVLGTDDEL